MDNSTPDIYEKLVQYLDGELSDDEKNAVEQQLSADSALKQTYDKLLLAKEAVRQFGLKEKVGGIHHHMMKELATPVKKISTAGKIIRYTITIAASVLLLISGYIAYDFFTLTSEKIFSSNFKPYNLSTVRDEGLNEDAFEKAYREKNYKLVLQLHESGAIRNQKNNFLCGIAALELNNNSKAINCFNEVIELNKKVELRELNDESEYYLFLSYLRNEDYDLALETMKSIRDNPNQLYKEKITWKLIQEVKLLKWR